MGIRVHKIIGYGLELKKNELNPNQLDIIQNKSWDWSVKDFLVSKLNVRVLQWFEFDILFQRINNKKYDWTKNFLFLFLFVCILIFLITYDPIFLV